MKVGPPGETQSSERPLPTAAGMPLQVRPTCFNEGLTVRLLFMLNDKQDRRRPLNYP
jgi:hypothetical protein